MAKGDSNGPRARRSRTPLTFYRSAATGERSPSPFKRRPPRAPSRLRKALFGLLDTILIAAIILGLIYAMIVKPSAKVDISSEAYHSKSNYQTAATQQFSRVQNRNKITLNEQAILRKLQKQFPEIESGVIELPLFSQKPTVKLNVSPPAFNLKSKNGVFVVDKQGVAIAKLSDLPQIKIQTLIIDQTNFDVSGGKAVLSADAVNFIETLLAQSHRAGVELKSLTLPPRAEELDIVTKDQPYYVKFYLGGDALVQSGQFLAARHQFSTDGNSPSQYLDVRVPGKIFYK